MSNEAKLLVWSIGIGFLPELVFQIQKNKSLESLLKVPFSRYHDYEYSYFTFDEFVYNPGRLLGRYVIFRFLPPTLALILIQAIQSTYFPELASFRFLLITALTSVSFRDVVFIFGPNRLERERILHFLVVVAVLSIGVLVWLVAKMVDFSYLAPEPDELVQGAWSTLLGASIVALYIAALREPGASSIYEQRSDHTKRAFILSQYYYLCSQFEYTFHSAHEKSECSLPLLYSIAIYEGMNRPKAIRALENLLVRIPGAQLTVGLMQVRSSRRISDEESITQAAKLLSCTDTAGHSTELWESPRVVAAVAEYNHGSSYSDQLRYVTEVLDEVAELWHEDSGTETCELHIPIFVKLSSALRGRLLSAFGRIHFIPAPHLY